MITRGHYIGEVIDNLSSLSHLIAMRSRVGSNDLNLFVENYFRDLLNAIHGTNLKNLNESGPNEAGLDLGDEDEKLGIQVTSRSDAAKIRNTLTKLTDEQKTKYTQIVVLVVGQKQGSYSLTDQLFKDFHFTEDNIWDVNTLARYVVDLDIDRLQKVHEIVRKESARVRVELELPDEKGNYPTSGYDKWEQTAKPKLTQGEAFIAHQVELGGEQLADKEIIAIGAGLAELAKRLSGLPRITREFLAMLYERCEQKTGYRPRLKVSYVKRVYRGDDLEGEIELLKHADLIDIDADDGRPGAAEISLYMPGRSDYLRDGFLEYVKAKGLSLRKVIGEADLSAF